MNHNNDETLEYLREQAASTDKWERSERTAQQIIDDIEYARKAAERYCRKSSLIQKQQS